MAGAAAGKGGRVGARGVNRVTWFSVREWLVASVERNHLLLVDNQPTTIREMFERMLERIQNMTEAELVDQLRALKAMRDSFGETLSFLDSVSLPVSEDREDEINKLRSTSRPSDSMLQLSDLIEDALKKRLEQVRKKGT